MNEIVDLEIARQSASLNGWRIDCQGRMARRFPGLDFESNHWPLRSKFNSDQKDWYFDSALADFKGRHQSFLDALRCYVAEIVLAGKPKVIEYAVVGFRFLAQSASLTVFQLTLPDLRAIEQNAKEQGKLSPVSADHLKTRLSVLERAIWQLELKEVLPRLGFQITKDTKTALSTAYRGHQSAGKLNRGSTLDGKIESFSEALVALADNDDRLDSSDRVCLCAVVLLMCAPSRINEPLCMSLDDIVDVDQYASAPESQSENELHSTHRLLLMKGSKGASWKPKPALTFLIGLLNFAVEEIKRLGSRSRTLIGWYQSHPNSIYLPPALEHLRGQDLTALDVARIVNLKAEVGVQEYANSCRIRERIGSSKVGENPNHRSRNGRTNSRKSVLIYAWDDAERVLLQDVRSAVDSCRKVSAHNHYKGDLCRMLFLHDRTDTPFKPWALSYNYLARRLAQSASEKRHSKVQTVFMKLGLTMPANGKIVPAWIHTHDPRRWLTTQALKHGEKLSDVLINEWANRRSLSHLAAYDYRDAEEIAAVASLPESHELRDLSQGLQKVQALEATFGLRTAVVSVPDADIKITSLDEVWRAVDDRPVARTANQIIILTPSKYGVCLFQDHEGPCMRDDPCITCNKNIVCKGHISTNEQIRSDCPKFVSSVIRQLDRLVLAHNRGIADNAEAMGEHVVALFKKGISTPDLAQELIRQFEEIKDTIEDKLLRKRLEEAFVATEMVKKLDDESVQRGALIKYHNPKNHAWPAAERALDSHGGREAIAMEYDKLIELYPQFGPRPLELEGQQSSSQPNGESSEEGGEQRTGPVIRKPRRVRRR